MHVWSCCRTAAACVVLLAAASTPVWASESVRAPGEREDACDSTGKPDADPDAAPLCQKSAAGNAAGANRKGTAPTAVSRRARWHRYLPGMIR